MPSASRLRCAAVAVAAIGGLLLSGCTGGAPVSTPRPSPSATPLYPSDEAALAAVKEAYGRYVEVSNQVANAGWVDVTPLKTVEKGDAYRRTASPGSGIGHRAFEAQVSLSSQSSGSSPFSQTK